MAQKHTHKLKRHKYKTGNAIYFCALPDCNYKIATSLALNKYCICWRCGEQFLMSEYAIRLAKPHCDKCHKPKHELEEHYWERSEPLTIPTADSTETLKRRLSGITHSSIVAMPDDEDI